MGSNRQEKFDLFAALRADGMRDEPTGYTGDDHFYYRMVGNDLQIAVRASFDRWANSTDFVAAVPKTRKAYDRFRNALVKAVLRGDYDPKSGEGRRL